uniref:Uncharacterized protein n=1 Tax=Arundo donax TaxID=35708 RepID=A0A0A9ERJ6_ARUDO
MLCWEVVAFCSAFWGEETAKYCRVNESNWKYKRVNKSNR